NPPILRCRSCPALPPPSRRSASSLAIAAQCARNTSLVPDTDERDMTRSTLNPRRCLNQASRKRWELQRSCLSSTQANRNGIRPPRGTHLQLRFLSSIDFVALKQIFERPIEIRVKRIKPVRLCRQVAPVLVHPEPRCRVLLHVRFK